MLVASPGPAHEAALLAAFAHDLPVLCEKPLTPDAASALRVLEAEQRLGHRRVQVGFMRRYDQEPPLQGVSVAADVLNSGCLEAGSQAVIVVSFAARGGVPSSGPTPEGVSQ